MKNLRHIFLVLFLSLQGCGVIDSVTGNSKDTDGCSGENRFAGNDSACTGTSAPATCGGEYSDFASQLTFGASTCIAQDSDDHCAQSFTMGSASQLIGRVTFAACLGASETVDNVYIEIWEGDGTVPETEIHETVIAGSNLSTACGLSYTVTAELSSDVELEADKKYWLVLHYDGFGAGDSVTHYRANDAYSGGGAATKLSGTWTAVSTLDHYFKIEICS